MLSLHTSGKCGGKQDFAGWESADFLRACFIIGNNMTVMNVTLSLLPNLLMSR